MDSAAIVSMSWQPSGAGVCEGVTVGCEGECLGGRGEEGRGTRALAGISKLVEAPETHRGARIQGSNHITGAFMAG